MKKKGVTTSALLATVVALLFLVSFLLPHRVALGLWLFVLPLSGTGAVVIVCLKKLKQLAWCFTVCTIVMFVSVMYCLYTGSSYTFLESSLPFWLISLIVSVTVCLSLAIKFFNRKIGVGVWVVCVLFCCLTLFATVNAYAQHLNFLLDTSEPVVYTAQIEKKDLDLHTKGPDIHQFAITVEGEQIWLEVTSQDYFNHEVGDAYTFVRYNGAFGKAFYIS